MRMPGTWSTGDKQARVTLSGSKMVAVNSVDQTCTIGESLVDARLEGHSPVAQSVERLTVNQEVAGSSPARGANYFEQLLPPLHAVGGGKSGGKCTPAPSHHPVQVLLV